MKKRDLPNPEEILEELADRAAHQIDRSAPVAFESALKELVRYHRFLLALNESRAEDGATFSLAEIGGFAWLAPHQEWVRQYRRLFERAIEHLMDDPRIVGRLAYVPRELLPRDQEFELSSPVLQAIVGLVPLLAHRLEAWVTKRTVMDSASGSVGAIGRLALSGPDRNIYIDVVSDVVGAWEGFLHDGGSLFGNSLDQNSTADERWAAHRRTWPFLWQHLHDTAYLVAIAVWNEDEIAAGLYCDALIRWPLTYDSDVMDLPDLPRSRLLLPSILASDWNVAFSQARTVLPDYVAGPKPDQLLNTIVRQAHIDVMLVSSALFLFWAINGKQLSQIGADIASALLQRKLNEPDDLVTVRPYRSSFRGRFFEVVRMAITGARWDRESYGAQLDHLIQTLDGMTERRVVSGRVYTPSTINDRQSLLVPLVVILLAELPEEGDDGLVDAIGNLAAKEGLLPQRDRSLRDLQRELESFLNALGTSAETLARGLKMLSPTSTYETASDNLQVILKNTISKIKSQRMARLKEEPVDPAKVERLRSALEAAVLTPPADVPFFRDFAIEPSIGDSSIDLKAVVLMEEFPKAQLVAPPMENEISRQEESFSSALRRWTAHSIWATFCGREREQVEADSTIDSEEFWRSVEQLASRAGPDPVLVISQRESAVTLRKLIYAQRDANIALEIKRQKPANVVGNYLATVQGVEVYGANFEDDVAWLFSGRSLRLVRYHALNQEGHVVSLVFDPGDKTEAPLKATVSQEVEWWVQPIFELKLIAPQ